MGVALLLTTLPVAAPAQSAAPALALSAPPAQPAKNKKAGRFKNALHTIGDNLKVDGTAGAGYAAVYVGEQKEDPAFTACNGCQNPPLIGDSIDVRAVNHYVWRPALSTGIVFHFFGTTKSQMGVGLGAHMVFVPDTNGKTSPFPALTLHLGTPKTEAFFGLILSPTDRTILPNGRSSVRLAKANQVPSFQQRSCCLSRNLYIGFQIFGTRQNEETTKEIADSASLTVADMALDPKDTTVAPGASFSLRRVLRDARGEEITQTVRFESDRALVARVTRFGGLVTASDTGLATITASAGGATRTATVHVKKP